MQLRTASTPRYDEIVALASRAPSVHDTPCGCSVPPTRTWSCRQMVSAAGACRLPPLRPAGQLWRSSSPSARRVVGAGQARSGQSPVAAACDPLLANVSFVACRCRRGHCVDYGPSPSGRPTAARSRQWPVPTRWLQETAERRADGSGAHVTGGRSTRSRLLALARRAGEQQRRDNGCRLAGDVDAEGAAGGSPAANRPTSELRDTPSEVAATVPHGDADGAAIRGSVGRSSGRSPLDRRRPPAFVPEGAQRPPAITAPGHARTASDVLVAVERPWRVTAASATLGQGRKRGQEASS
jgi:hypothetical protein